MKRILTTMFILTAFASASIFASGKADKKEVPVEEVTEENKEGFEEAGRKVGEVGKAIGEAGKEAGKEIGSAAKAFGKGLKDGISSESKK